jgi:transposase
MARKKKNPAAVVLSKLAAKGRMKKLTPKQRSEIARNAARARWAKAKKGATDKEIAGVLGISEKRLDSAFSEAGLHPHPEKTAPGRARVKKAKRKGA